MAKKTAPQLKQEKDTDSLYLKKLKFDPKLHESFVARYITNVRLLVLIALTIFAAGIYSFINLPRELNPEIDIPIIAVNTILPGAAPKDVESLITKKIEKVQTNLTNLDTMESTSRDSASTVVFRFLSTQDSNQALQQVKEQVDRISSELPDDATDPVVEKFDFNDQPIWQFALVGDIDPISMTRIAQDLQEKLEKTPGVKKVTLTGQEKEEVVVALKAESLKNYALSEQQVIQALKANNVNFPAGVVSVNNLEYTVSLNNELSTVEKIRTLPVSVGGQVLQLSEVADIQMKSADTAGFAHYSERNHLQQTAIEIGVYKASAQKISTAYERAKNVIDTELKKYPQVRYVTLTDIAKESADQFADLQRNFLNSILFIFIALCIFLGVRQALTASLSMPLALLNAFIIMSVFGITMNFLSLFSLLLAVSLVGDDAIVISQAIRRYHEKFSAIETGLLVFKDYVIPIWSGTITVVWSFLPLLMASGIIGEFIKPIPIVVSATLLSSTAVAVFLNLPFSIVLAELNIPKRVVALLSIAGSLLTVLLLLQLVKNSQVAPVVIIVYLLFLLVLFFSRNTLKASVPTLFSKLHFSLPTFLEKPWKWLKEKDIFRQGIIDLSAVASTYRSLITRLITKARGRWIIYGTVFFFIIVAGVFFWTGLLKQEFFPKTNENQFFVNVEGTPGWPATKTLSVVNDVEKKIVDIPEVKYVLTTTNFSIDATGSRNTGAHLGLIHVILEDKENRQRTSSDISEEIRKDFTQFVDAKVSVLEPGGGPPAGADFQANIRGDEMTELENISQDFMKYLDEIDGVVNISSSLKSSTGQVKVELIPTEMQKRGLSAIQVASWLRTALSGNQASKITLEDKEHDITVTMQEQKQSLGYLQNLTVPSPTGGKYALSEIARFTLENSPSTITRENGSRVVRVSASGRGMSAQEMLQQFNDKTKNYKLKEGYTWDVGGANEENAKSVQSIIQAMGLSFLLILVTMVIVLGSFRKAVMVLAIIPLAVAGVFINFTIFGIPLSFPALIGVLALFGIVVNNAIMIVEKINLNLEYDFEFYEGVIDASASRVEPIFLSSFTAILGLLPITISDPLWRGLGGAIVAGLSLSGLLVLFLMPALFVELFRPSLPKKK